MDFKTQIERATTGAELVLIAESAKITLPGGFAKMEIDRKKRVLLTLLPAPVPAAEAKTAAKGVVSKALANFGSRLRGAKKVDPATLSPVEREKFLWEKRKERGSMGMHATRFFAARKAADDPVPLTRQVRRANERRTDKLLRSNLKAMAMKDKVQGGSAVVTMKDVRAVRAGSGMHAHS